MQQLKLLFEQIVRFIREKPFVTSFILNILFSIAQNDLFILKDLTLFNHF